MRVYDNDSEFVVADKISIKTFQKRHAVADTVEDYLFSSVAAALTDMNDNDYAEMGVSDDSVRHVVHYLLYAVFRPRECVHI